MLANFVASNTEEGFVPKAVNQVGYGPRSYGLSSQSNWL